MIFGPYVLVSWLQPAAPQEPPHALPDRVEYLRHLRVGWAERWIEG